MEQIEKTVYFLGAGATKAACKEVPINQDLVRRALGDFSGTIQAQSINVFIDNLSKQRKDFPRDNQIWNLLDYIIQQGKSASSKHSLEQVAELRTGLISLVIREFEKSLRNANTQIFEDFVTKIEHTKASIISTNYDIMIDNAFSNKSFNYGAKMRKVISRAHLDGASGLRRPEEAGCPGGLWLNQGNIPILKIHGSLNWLYCPKCDEVDITIREKGARELVEADFYCCDKNCTSKYEPLLITPTMYKSYENRIIKETWNCAEKELEDAENIVFIGYSLKEEDYQIRCLLMKALLNKDRNYKSVTVVEMEPKTPKDKKLVKTIKQKYNDLYGHIDFKPIGFQQYVKDLI